MELWSSCKAYSRGPLWSWRGASAAKGFSVVLVFSLRPCPHWNFSSLCWYETGLLRPRLLTASGRAKIYGMPVALARPDIGVRASARFLKGLGDATRLRILELLLERERTVGEIVELLGLSQARASTHLACLRWCGYVQARKDGRRVWYAVKDRRIERLLHLVDELAAPNARHLATCTRIGPEWV